MELEERVPVKAGGENFPGTRGMAGGKYWGQAE